MKAFWAEDRAYPDEAGGTVIARSEEEATAIAARMLNVDRDGLNLYSAETADGAIKDHLGELDHAMQKASDAARAEEREACAAIAEMHADVPQRVLSSAEASEAQRELASDRVALARNIASVIRSRSKGGA